MTLELPETVVIKRDQLLFDLAKSNEIHKAAVAELADELEAAQCKLRRARVFNALAALGAAGGALVACYPW